MSAKTEARRITGEIARELERFVLDAGKESDRLRALLAKCVTNAGGAATAEVEEAPALVQQLRTSYEQAVVVIRQRDAEVEQAHTDAIEREKPLRSEAVRLREVLAQIREVALDKGWDDAGARHEIYDLAGSA